MKCSGGLGIERNVDLPQCFVSFQVGVDVVQRHRFLRIGKLDANQLFGIAHHIFRDA